MSAEIISTVERRRQWPAEDKLRIMSEALAPGVTIAATADRHGVCRSQLYVVLLIGLQLRDPAVRTALPLALGVCKELLHAVEIGDHFAALAR